MEVNLPAVCSAKPPAIHGGPRQEQKVLFSELLFPPPLPRGNVRYPQPGKPPDRRGSGVSHADQQSGGGDPCPAISRERRRGSSRPWVGGVHTTPLGYALVSVCLASVSLSLR